MLHVTQANGQPCENTQYLRELAILEVIYGDLDNEQIFKDPDKVNCMQHCVANVAEVYTECSVLVWQLIDNNDLEKWRGTNAG